MADVGAAATSSILESMKAMGADGGRAALRSQLLEILFSVPRSHSSGTASPRVTMLVGVNGVGKTTTVAKLAHRAGVSGRSAVVVAADTFRAAAKEQLTLWAERLGVQVVTGESGQDPASVAHDGVQLAVAQGVDDVFVDTAGRLHTKKPLMDELHKVARVISKVIPEAPHETLLVMDATVGSNGLTQAKEFQAALSLDGIVLTKMDGTAKGGIVIAIAHELRLPVRYVGVGESAEDMLPFDQKAFVASLFEPSEAVTG